MDDDYSVDERQEICIGHGAGPGGSAVTPWTMLNVNKGGRSALLMVPAPGAVQSHHGAMLNVNKGDLERARSAWEGRV